MSTTVNSVPGTPSLSGRVSKSKLTLSRKLSNLITAMPEVSEVSFRASMLYVDGVTFGIATGG